MRISRVARYRRSPLMAALSLLACATACKGSISGTASSGGSSSQQPGGGGNSGKPGGTSFPGVGGNIVVPETGGPAIDAAQAFACTPAANGASPARIWRITSNQYYGSVALLNDDHQGSQGNPTKVWFDLATPFVLIAPDRFTTFAQSYTMTDVEFRRAIDTAAIVGEQFMLNDKSCLPKATDLSPPSDSCLQWLGRVLFRRPLTSDEMTEYRTLAENAKTMNAGHPASLVVEAMMMAPQFLYRSEIGSPDSASGLNKLDQFETATAIAMTLTDTPPDNTIYDAASKGELGTADQVTAHVKRLLGDLKSNTKVMQFFQEYFKYPQSATIFKDAVKGVDWSPGDLIADTDALVGTILTEYGSKLFFETLLTTNIGFYGSYTQTNNNRSDRDPTARAPARTVFDPTERAGILTQPSWLGTFSSANDNKPVQRGRFVSESLLCRPTPSLPIGTIPIVPDLGPNSTLRDRMAIHSKDPGCQACHKLTDPIGLSFEYYDHFGRVRTTDAGNPPDGSGVLTDSGNQDGPFKTPIELATKLAQSSVVKGCIIRHSFRFWMGRNEEVSDACSLSGVLDAYQKSGGDFTAMMTALFTSPSFSLRLPN